MLNFKIQLDKSELLRREVAYLGQIITSEGMPTARTAKEIKLFVELTIYYC